MLSDRMPPPLPELGLEVGPLEALGLGALLQVPWVFSSPEGWGPCRGCQQRAPSPGKPGLGPREHPDLSVVTGAGSAAVPY